MARSADRHSRRRRHRRRPASFPPRRSARRRAGGGRRSLQGQLRPGDPRRCLVVQRRSLADRRRPRLLAGRRQQSALAQGPLAAGRARRVRRPQRRTRRRHQVGDVRRRPEPLHRIRLPLRRMAQPRVPALQARRACADAGGGAGPARGDRPAVPAAEGADRVDPAALPPVERAQGSGPDREGRVLATRHAIRGEARRPES